MSVYACVCVCICVCACVRVHTCVCVCCGFWNLHLMKTYVFLKFSLCFENALFCGVLDLFGGAIGLFCIIMRLVFSHLVTCVYVFGCVYVCVCVCMCVCACVRVHVRVCVSRISESVFNVDVLISENFVVF